MTRLPLLAVAFVSALVVAQLRAQSCMDLALEEQETVRQAHVNVIKRAILFKLQLTEEPANPRGQIVVPQPMLEEYRAVSAAQKLVSQQRAGCVEQPEVSPQFVILQPEQVLRRSGHHGVFGDYPLSSSHAQWSFTHFLKFDLNLSNKDVIASAELRLWYHILNREALRPQDKQRISIYHILKAKSDTYYGEDPIFFCTRALVSLDRDGYVSFNITRAIKQWSDELGVVSGSFYLEVDVENLQSVDDSGQLVFRPPAIRVAYTDIEGRYSKTTQLVLRAHLSDEQRRRRQVGGRIDPSCSAMASRNCCKRDLVLDIHRDLNWYWVLRPRTLPINFCSGLCSLNWPTATYHTLLSLVYSAQQENPTGSPNPCCVPDKFASLPFLIFNGTTLELISIDDISIESCMCR